MGDFMVMLMVMGETATVTVAVVAIVPISSCMGVRMRVSGRTRMTVPAGVRWLDGGEGIAGWSGQIGQIDLFQLSVPPRPDEVVPPPRSLFLRIVEK